ncbi:ABC transporter permease [Microbacteriaceae bacterium VKM Ac-2855]|nr:ABC transporter permease [Microbacteriaceae bacterium VKM Ac-2855]
MSTQTTRLPAPALRVDVLKSVLPYAALIALYLATVLIAPGYGAPEQISSLLQLASLLGIVAIGQTLVILIAGIDLSVGAVITLTNLVTGSVLNAADVNIGYALLLSLLTGGAVGLINGFVIAKLRVPDLVATLATMTIVLGAGYLFTSGAPRGTVAPGLASFVTERFGGLFTGIFVLWVLLAAAAVLMLRRTVLGHYVYAVGLNRQASRFAGINVSSVTIVLYTISGLLAGLTGFLLTGYTGASYLNSGTTYQLATVAAVVLGGASIFGGRGSYIGTIAGVLITVLLQSLLRVIGIPQAGQNITYGAVILIMTIVFTRGFRTAASR